ncbi:MAG: mechanosensitive ion channel [Proteobacteria bacterium]|nr:mechanosensitive ion channel [Pseudomonadota bacterium]
MAETTANLTDLSVLSSLFDDFIHWLQSSVFVVDTLIGIGIVILAGLIAWPLAGILRTRLERMSRRHSRYRILVSIWKTSTDLSFPAVWLALQWISVLITARLAFANGPLVITSSLLAAWVIVRFVTMFVSSPFWSQTIAISAWLVAALNILGFLSETVAFLDGASFTIGQVTISILAIIQGVITLGVLLWITSIVSQITESKLKSSVNLTPSMQVLSIKFLHIGLGSIAFITALAIVGVDLTALAVVGGAVGVGLGFGLQKIFANLISGFILLMDKSIKPGDVIAIEDFFGRVDALGARYVSVTTLDGIEHLIPNEELIANRVENWSHSQNLLRLRQSVGVHYRSDIHKAMQLCLDAIDEVDRILKDPQPKCLLREFGDSSVDLEIRFWINDPMNGRANVISQVLLLIWDKFHEHGIEIPYPQRDLHIRSSSIGKLSEDPGESPQAD